ncbi:MAG: IS5 family transposase [Rhodospirillales bacterium]
MWNPESRARHCRVGLRYPSDLSDAEWAVIAPQIPPGRRGGRRRSVDLRAVLNGMLYVLETGCQWRHLPGDLPPRSTCHSYLQLWAWDGTLERIHHELYRRVREQQGREASPTAAVIDSQSVRAAEKGGPHPDPVGYDAGKKIKGVKYHILVDTLGLLLSVAVHHAGIQDRDGAALVLDKKTRALFPFIRVIFADGGYQGPVAATAVAKTGDWQLSIVKRSDQAKGFIVLPKRWLVERTLAWLTRCRRLVRHYELSLHTSAAFIRLAMI